MSIKQGDKESNIFKQIDMINVLKCQNKTKNSNNTINNNNV